MELTRNQMVGGGLALAVVVMVVYFSTNNSAEPVKKIVQQALRATVPRPSFLTTDENGNLSKFDPSGKDKLNNDFRIEGQMEADGMKVNGMLSAANVTSLGELKGVSINSTGNITSSKFCSTAGTCLEDQDLKRVKSLWIKDTRSTNDTPQKYRDTYTGQLPLTIKEFKENNAINTPYKGVAGFCTLETTITWPDASGGGVVQFVFPNGGSPGMPTNNVGKKRYELTATTWSPWVDINLNNDNKFCIGEFCFTENDFKRLWELSGEVGTQTVNTSFKLLSSRVIEPLGTYRIEIFEKNDGTYIDASVTNKIITSKGNNIDIRLNGSNQIEVMSKNGNTYYGKDFKITRLS